MAFTGRLLVQDLETKRQQLSSERAIQQGWGSLRKYLSDLAPAGDFRLFPSQKGMVEKAIAVFQTYSGYLLTLIAVIFAGRIVYYEFSLAPPEKYSELISNTFVCFFLMSAFPTLFRYMAEYSDAWLRT